MKWYELVDGVIVEKTVSIWKNPKLWLRELRDCHPTTLSTTYEKKRKAKDSL